MQETFKPHIKIADRGGNLLTLEITSDLGNVIRKTVNAESFYKWQDGGAIHRCFPDFDIVTRELMISSMDPITQKDFYK